MAEVSLTVIKVRPAIPFFSMVQAFVELISQSPNRLTYDKGLKRLYASVSGCDTLNDQDITGITDKAIRLGLVPGDMTGFMNQSIRRNCQVYAAELIRLINARFVGISNGEVTNEDTSIRYNPSEARRNFYLPTPELVRKLWQAVDKDDAISRFCNVKPIVYTLKDAAYDSKLYFQRVSTSEGRNTSDNTCYGALSKLIKKMSFELGLDNDSPIPCENFRNSALPLLSILLDLAKLLYGDLTLRPARANVNQTDLRRKLAICDGTLAALPFPTCHVIEQFEESTWEQQTTGMSAKARAYLNAVSAAEFFRLPRFNDEG